MSELVVNNIDVSAKIIADISSGIYRTPANALKELVSNAWDAKADKVIITTNYPFFDFFTIFDDGRGMTPEKFTEIMKTIGGSDKRVVEEEYEGKHKDRPLIGKIGIGILAVAQLCRKFTVISSTLDSPSRFEATIDLQPFHEQDAYKLNLRDEKVKIGKYFMEKNIPDEKNEQYTKIVLEDIDDGFKNRLMDVVSSSIADFKFENSEPSNYPEFINWMQNKKVQEIPEYLRLIWELSQITPTTYLENGPVPTTKIIDDIKEHLVLCDFKIILDGIRLFRPVKLPYQFNAENKFFDYKVYNIEFNGVVNGSPLVFSGYIYHQNKAIKPPELRGLNIRIKNVGITGYDKTFLNFPQSAGPMLTGMTGEIYVTEGLEDALNIDRNSFRETDPHFEKLQEVIFAKLSLPFKEGGILADARVRSNNIQKLKRAEKITGEYTKFIKDINKILNSNYKIEIKDEFNDNPIMIDDKRNKITIYNKSKLLPRGYNDKIIFSKFIIIYELSKKHSSKTGLFYDFIKRMI